MIPLVELTVFTGSAWVTKKSTRDKKVHHDLVYVVLDDALVVVES